MDGGINGRVGIYEGGGARFLLFSDGRNLCKDDREWLSSVTGRGSIVILQSARWSAFQDFSLKDWLARQRSLNSL